MKKNILITIIAGVAILVLSSCSASFRLHVTNPRRGRSYINMTDGTTGTYKKWDDNMFFQIELDYRPERVYGEWCESGSFNNFGIRGHIGQRVSHRDTAKMRYRRATLHSIVIVVNDKDTLPWVMDKFQARVYDSLVRNYPHQRDSVQYYNYTNDSLPLQVVTSGLDRDWELLFDGMTIPFDIQKVRKMKVEIKTQVDDYMVTRTIKARRFFFVWLEPRQGFSWYGPQSASLWSNVF